MKNQKALSQGEHKDRTRLSAKINRQRYIYSPFCSSQGERRTGTRFESQVLTTFYMAEAGHHLRGSFKKRDRRSSSWADGHHAHPLQRRGEWEPPHDRHWLTDRLQNTKDVEVRFIQGEDNHCFLSFPKQYLPHLNQYIPQQTRFTNKMPNCFFFFFCR